MKKPTITIDELRHHLMSLALELHCLAQFDFETDEVAILVDAETFHEDFFAFSDPEPAPSRGRGKRIFLHLDWVWWPARISPDEGAALVTKKLNKLPGLEEVTTPKLDPQFGLFWRIGVVIRVSQ